MERVHLLPENWVESYSCSSHCLGSVQLEFRESVFSGSKLTIKRGLRVIYEADLLLAGHTGEEVV